MKIAEFIGALFLARNVAHSVHLNTRSFAKHAALGDFYEEIVGLADKLAECYQGKYGLIGPISVPLVRKTAGVLEFLESQSRDIEKSRYEVIDKDCTALHNIVDEILGLYYRTLYKLRFLA
jgi:hypothetical protein